MNDYIKASERLTFIEKSNVFENCVLTLVCLIIFCVFFYQLTEVIYAN